MALPWPPPPPSNERPATTARTTIARPSPAACSSHAPSIRNSSVVFSTTPAARSLLPSASTSASTSALTSASTSTLTSTLTSASTSAFTRLCHGCASARGPGNNATSPPDSGGFELASVPWSLTLPATRREAREEDGIRGQEGGWRRGESRYAPAPPFVWNPPGVDKFRKMLSEFFDGAFQREATLCPLVLTSANAPCEGSNGSLFGLETSRLASINATLNSTRTPNSNCDLKEGSSFDALRSDVEPGWVSSDDVHRSDNVLRDLFDEIDANHDGELSAEEIHSYAKKKSLPTTYVHEFLESARKRRFPRSWKRDQIPNQNRIELWLRKAN